MALLDKSGRDLYLDAYPSKVELFHFPMFSLIRQVGKVGPDHLVWVPHPASSSYDCSKGKGALEKADTSTAAILWKLF